MITTPLTLDFLRGFADIERTERGIRPHRLPQWVRELFPDPQLMMVEAQPSGVRVVAATTARGLELVTHPSRVGYKGADRPRGHVDLVVDGEFFGSDALTGGDLTEIDLQTGTTTLHQGQPHTSTFSGLPEGDKIVELWLPHNETIEIVDLRSDAPLASVAPTTRTWLHYGSSISHGSNSSSPTRIWPAVAALRGGVELHNLGFGGSAFADPFLAKVMRDTPADLISVKLGINIVNLDAFRLRTLVPVVHGFLDTIREGHPDTPIVLISPIFCGIHEDTPGPGAIDPASLDSGQVRFTATGTTGDTAFGRLTLRVIREALASLVKRRAADANLHYLDGTELYGEADSVEHPLPDALHPDTATHRIIGERFAQYAFGESGPFAER